MKNKVRRLFILDDNLPKIPEFVDRDIFSRPISQDDLGYLVRHADWTGELNLKQLTEDLLNHHYVEEGLIEISAYTNPEICLSNLSEKDMPDVIIYDWEYENQPQKSGPWLLEILGMTTAVIFVYSAKRNSIPPTLNKEEFDQFAERFQLFAKGDSKDSIFTSEEFLYQYILNLVNGDNVIHVGGLEVQFKVNGYLESPSDILHLESILGRASLLEHIKENNNCISTESVERIVESMDGRMLLSQHRRLLITADFPLLDKQAAEEISYLAALKTFGLEKLKEAIQTGFARI